MAQDWVARVVALFPHISSPTEKNLGLKTKLKWTFIILVLYFIMKHIPLYGLGQNGLESFSQISVLLAADFGSIISLGIGPIVTASIVLQLVNGSGLYKFDTSTQAGKAKFQNMQKLLMIFFVIFEAIIYVVLGGLAPDPGLTGVAFATMEAVLIGQLILGGFMIILMDEMSNKWGIGSGVSLFIAAGVSESLFVRIFSPVQSDTGAFVGAIPALFQSLGAADTIAAVIAFTSIVVTVAIFVLCVYANAMKVEIPLSFGRVRGHGIRWPLNFMYTNVLPILLISALLANIQLGATLLSRVTGWDPAAVTAWVSPPNLLQTIIQSQTIFLSWQIWAQVAVYSTILIIGAMVFSYFWMQTSGMDARSQAKNIMGAGLQIPGHRRDPRVMEHLLNRYIVPLTIMGGAAIGVLAVVADISGALSSGTGILLTVMIIYKFYEDLARKHVGDMNPMMRRFMGK